MHSREHGRVFGALLMVMLAFVAGCQHESEREVLMGLAEPRLPTFTARGYDVPRCIAQACAADPYRYAMAEVEHHRRDWVWAVGYYQMRWSDGGARPAIPDVAILVIYENRQGQLGYITNCAAISAYTSEMQSGQPIVLHEIVAGPPDGGDGDTERSGKHMAKVAADLHRLVSGAMPATISMEPEGRVLGGTIIDVVESVGPAGRSYIVGVNSIETVRDDVEKDDRLSLAAFGVLDLWHDMLRLTRMGFNKNGISVPLVGMAEAEQRSATAPAAATGEEKR